MGVWGNSLDKEHEWVVRTVTSASRRTTVLSLYLGSLSSSPDGNSSVLSYRRLSESRSKKSPTGVLTRIFGEHRVPLRKSYRLNCGELHELVQVDCEHRRRLIVVGQELGIANTVGD